MCFPHVTTSLRRGLSGLALASLCGLALSVQTGHAQTSVLTQHNDNARTGANTSETILTPASVNVTGFGKLFTRTLDANVNGQVLYVPGLTIGGVTHNVLFAYTSNNANNSPSSVYAFDADDPNATAPLWRQQFTAGSARWTTATPVIDSAAKIIYVLTKDTTDTGPTKLHALDLLTGAEKPGSPVTIAATVPGTGDGSSGGSLSFSTSQHNCRPGLLLVNGVVYIAFAHNTDSFPYHGWLFGYSYNGTSFTQTAVYNTSPNGGESGVWQAGKGIAADASGNIYMATGNGTFNANTGGTEYGMSYVKLATPSLTVLDYFAPYDELPQSNADLDLGGAGILNIPGTNRVFGGGTKFGSVFLLDSTNLGHFTPNGPDNVIQRLNGISSNSNVGQNPVAWDAGSSAKYVYLWPRNTEIKQFKYDPAVSKFNPAGVYKQTTGFGNGGSLSVSSSGTGGGILWGVGSNAVVHAFDATDVTKTELWNSGQNAARDGLGTVGKWQFPTIANGKVYVPTGSGTIVAYGLLGGGGGGGTTILPSADAFVRAGSYANTNFGSDPTLVVKTLTKTSSDPYNRVTYLKFDLTNVTTAPSSAKLNLYVTNASVPSNATMNMQVNYVLDTTWTEGGITWNNAPSLNRTNVTSTGYLVTTKAVPTTPGPISIDLTALVANRLGVVITIQLIDSTNSGVYIVTNSKEAANNKPSLVITP